MHDACRFCGSYGFKDAPAKVGHLFHQRVQHFMRDILCAGRPDRRGALGRVTNYVVRYEVQHRHSVHAHIILWLHPDDVERVTSEIRANIPAKYRDPDAESCPTCSYGPDKWEPPDDDLGRRLYLHVMTKQLHECNPALEVEAVCCLQAHH